MELEELVEKFAKLGEKTVLWTTVFAVGLCLLLIELAELLHQGSDFLEKLIHAGVYLQKDEVRPYLWFLSLFGFLIFATVVLAVLLLHAKLNRKTLGASQNSLIADLTQQKAGLQESNRRAQTCITAMMTAAIHIRAQQTPDASHTIKTIENVRIIYRISKDFSADVIREYTVKAAGDPLHFWQSSITPSSYATPAEYLDDIRFQVLDITRPNEPAPVTFLQTENQPLHKSVCIYFLPRLEPGDPARVIQVSYKWPGYFLEMKNSKRENIESSFKTAETTKSVRIEIFLQDGSGGHSVARSLPSFTPTPSPQPRTFKPSGMDTPTKRKTSPRTSTNTSSSPSGPPPKLASRKKAATGKAISLPATAL
ncbi:hypothetical protein GCM10011507_00040 [Edaphobacter acidisoli]|uniref:Uncharacterized protein n=1 Tax=Edaphobacter acidisoli TaxID=2040573 RepID=A0A916VY95_9BACT|nr:hypothetical protein [Edaphobacter acidisoli]GGA52982.1 hypothetical protein GCM10011507_00040 [Edaphobacter acidisoli]